MGLATVTSASTPRQRTAFDLDNVSNASMRSSNLYRSTAMPTDCLLPHAGFGPFLKVLGRQPVQARAWRDSQGWRHWLPMARAWAHRRFQVTAF